MTLSQLRYAVEMEKAGSITAAARNLYMGQPNLSKSIRELEEELGVTLFLRTPQGVVPTADGIKFLSAAREILRRADALASAWRSHGPEGAALLVAAPPWARLGPAVSRLAARYSPDAPLDIRVRECGWPESISLVASQQAHLGILRYTPGDASAVERLAAQQNLAARMIREYPLLPVLSLRHPLAGEESITPDRLRSCTCLVCEAVFAGAIPDLGEPARQIRMACPEDLWELLHSLPGSYLWAPPLSQEELKRQELTQPFCLQAPRLLECAVWRASPGLSPTARQFVEEVCLDPPA